MNPQAIAIRYTKGPEAMGLGPVSLIRADLDKDADPTKSRDGWRETTNEIALQAILPERIEEFGFEARNHTPAPVADASPAAATATAPTAAPASAKPVKGAAAVDSTIPKE